MEWGATDDNGEGSSGTSCAHVERKNSTTSNETSAGEGPSGMSPFYVDRNNSAISDETSAGNDPPITSIARSARVIRRSADARIDNGESMSGVRMIYNPARAYREELIVSSPFGPPIEPLMDTTMGKGEGKALMLTSRGKVEHNTTFASDNGKGKAVEPVDGVNEAIGTLAADKRKRPGPTPIQMDWSRLTNPAYVGQRSYGTSIPQSQFPEAHTSLTDLTPMSSPAGKPYEIRDGKYGKGMFSTKHIARGEIIVEEDYLIRLLCFDVYASEDEGVSQYQEKIETLRYQFDRLDELRPDDRLFIENLEPFDGEEPFIERVMRKYGFEAYHPSFFHCTALYRDICRVNHCCDNPNASLKNRSAGNDWSTGRLAAIRGIANGEEIMIDYTVMERKRLDKKDVCQMYRFICTCSACKFPPNYNRQYRSDTC